MESPLGGIDPRLGVGRGVVDEHAARIADGGIEVLGGAWLVWQGDYGFALFLGVWGMFVISGVDNILKPYLISRGGNLPLVVVLLGVFGGVLAFGFMGLFLGPTLLAVAFSLLGDWLIKEVPQTAEKDSTGEPIDKPQC